MASNLRYGSRGSEVKDLQRRLNQQGYSLAEDGIFGNKTQAAVRDYQKKNRLDVDGIAGRQTLGKLGRAIQVTDPINDGKAGLIPSATIDDATSSKGYQYDPYEESDELLKAKEDKAAHDATKPVFGYSIDELMRLIADYNGRDPVSYDFNADALYQQYKDKYIQQGKMAMQDTIGQASAMTGGYGNSYAATAGNQAYQASLQNLNDVIPELYQMAYDRYNQEGQDMLTQISLEKSIYDTEYGEYMDLLGQHNIESDRLQSIIDNLTANELNMHQFDTTMDYNQHRDTEDDAYRDATLAETIRMNDFTIDQAEKAASSGSGSGGNGGNGGGKTPVKEDTSIPASVISEVQNYVTAEAQADYLAKEVANGRITEEQAYALLDEYKPFEMAALNQRTWSVVDDGGTNWFWGVDNNASVKDQYGNTYTLKELKKELEKTMTSKQAKDYILKLQKQLGI